MEITTKKLIANFIFYFLIVFVVVAMIMLIFYLKSEGTQCLKNPFVYGASEQIVGQGDQNYVSCSCIVGHEQSISSNFCFNEIEVKIGNDCNIGYNSKEEDNENLQYYDLPILSQNDS